MSIEASMKSVKEASKDENVGLILSAVKTTDIKRGMVVCKPGSVKAYSEFSCRIYLMTKAEGGRSTPIFNAYRPQFYFFNVGISGEVILPEGKESLSPGDNATVTVKLLTPVAMEKEMEFYIREGSRAVGKGNAASFTR
jgi:elongation factor Tu